MSTSRWKLPESWCWSKIAEIGDVSSGGTPSTKEEDNFGDKHPWLTPADLSGYSLKFIQRGKRNLSEKGLRSCSAKLLPPGTVLFSSRAPIGYTVIASNPIATNQGFKNVTAYDALFNEYIYHWLKGNKSLAEEYASGTTFKELSAKRMKQIPIPIPPYNEQVRIVVRVEELFSQLEVGVRSLQATQTQLEQYRQATLRQAYTGKLTEKIRKSERISHSNQINDQINQLREIYGIKKPRKISDLNTHQLNKLPDNWMWVRINDLAIKIQYGSSSKARKEKGIPVLRMGNIIGGELDYSNLKYYDQKSNEIEELLLEEGDILFNRTNSAELVGKTAVYYDKYPDSVFASYLMRVKVFKDYIFPEIISEYINSIFGRNYIARVKSQQVGQANVNGTKLAEMPIPLIPRNEQESIMEFINTIKSQLKHLK